MTHTPREVWKSIDGYKDFYEVSNQGRISSLGREIVTKFGFLRQVHGRIFTGSGSGPRRHVVLRDITGNKSHRLIHDLVAHAFCPGYAPDLIVRHIDGDQTNNKAANLEWIAHAKNQQHAMSALTPNKVRRIRKLYATGKFTQQEIGNMFDLVQQAVSDIINHKRWKNV